MARPRARALVRKWANPIPILISHSVLPVVHETLSSLTWGSLARLSPMSSTILYGAVSDELTSSTICLASVSSGESLRS